MSKQLLYPVQLDRKTGYFQRVPWELLDKDADSSLLSKYVNGLEIDPHNLYVLRQIFCKMNFLLEMDSSNTKFPGSIPLSLMRKTLETFLNCGSLSYVGAKKSNGVRCLMICTKISLIPEFAGRESPACVLMYRNGQCFLTNMFLIREAFYEGTILDGELCVSPNSHLSSTFWIFDCLSMPVSYKFQKNRTSKKWLSKHPKHRDLFRRYFRLKTAPTESALFDPRWTTLQLHKKSYGLRRFFAEFFVEELVSNIVICRMALKPIAFMKDLPKLLPIWEEIERDRHQLYHPSDPGVVFTPLQLPFLSGHSETLFKFKGPEDQTIECLMKIPLQIPSCLINPKVDIFGKPLDIQPIFSMKSLPSDYSSQTCSILELWVTENDFKAKYDPCFFAYTYVTPKELEALDLPDKAGLSLLNHEIGEFALDLVHLRFQLVKFRHDRSNPNILFTAKKTILTAIEGIRADELFYGPDSSSPAAFSSLGASSLGSSCASSSSSSSSF